MHRSTNSIDVGPTAGPVGPRGSMFGRRRRRSRLGLVAGLLAVAVGVGIWAMRAPRTPAVADPGGDARAAAAPADDAGTADAPADAAPADAALPAVFARTERLALRLPADDVVLVGFHEASRKEAVGLTPVGVLMENANTTRIQPPPDTDGPEYVILSSRGRAPAPTSAVDLVMRDDTPVRSPVSGEVVDVREYFLYGKHRDHRVEIAPDGAPHLRVVLIHVRDVAVGAGDRVEAGTTILAGSANRFPFGSHIDRYTEPDRWPHVHVEVKSTRAPD